MRTIRTGWIVMLVAALSACGAGPAEHEPTRPVLVTQPSAGGQGGSDVFPGEVHAREESPLSFRIGGSLVRRHVDAGAQVRRGDVLAELDPGDMELQVQAAEAELVRLQGDLDRLRALLEQKLVSQSAYDAQQAAYRAARAQYEVARNQSAYTRLRAPRDGVIASRQAEAGQVVAAGQTVFTLAADGGREVVIALPEARIREFHVGQPALVELWSVPDRPLPAHIREIAPAADPQTRTYQARVALEDEVAAGVDLGQSARVHVRPEGGVAALEVPLSAIQRGADGATSVWVVDPQTSTLRARAVRTGPYDASRVPVLEGLAADDWVVAAGGHLLREGQAVLAVDRSNRPVFTAAAGQAE
jgi:multidrug efflux system membrane fusion protein